MRSLGQNPTEAELSDKIRELDSASHDVIAFPQFLSLMSSSSCGGDTTDEMIEAFRSLDKEGKGFLPVATFKHILENCGERLTEEEIDDILRDGTVNDEGMINYEELIKMAYIGQLTNRSHPDNISSTTSSNEAVLSAKRNDTSLQI